MPLSICLQKGEFALWKNKSHVSEFQLSGFNIKLTFKQVPIATDLFALQATVTCGVQPDQKLWSSDWSSETKEKSTQSLVYYLDLGETSETAAVSYRSIPLTQLPKEEYHVFPAENMKYLLGRYGRIQVNMGVAVELRCTSQDKILTHVE